MGWLKPEEDLIDPEFRGDWAHLRERAAPAATPANTSAVGTTVRGLRLDGAVLAAVEVDLDRGFDVCPVPELLGLPLMAKRLGADEAQEEPDSGMRSLVLNRLMSTPGIGLPLAWQTGGPSAALPPVLLARGDGVPFGRNEFECLKEFFVELDHEEPADRHERMYQPHQFTAWIGHWTRSVAFDGARADADIVAFEDLEPAFEHRFPIGVRVTARGLTAKAELNGKSGVVAKYDAAKRRVGVEFERPHGLLSLKPSNLDLDPEARRRELLREKGPSAGTGRQRPSPSRGA